MAKKKKTPAASLARQLANPGLRSKLPDSQLTPALLKQRRLNARLNAPVTQGSSMTNRDLARSANAATTEKYGEAEAEAGRNVGRAQARATDTAGWYAAYQQELQQRSINQQAIGAAGVAQQQGLIAGVQGLDQASLNAQQGAANADAASRGVATAQDQSGLASGASTARQQLLAAFGAEQAATNSARNSYADTQARVVAPGLKLRAQAQGAQGVKDAQDQQADLKRTSGAYKQNYKQQAVAEEFKNILAQQALGLDVQKAADSTRLEEGRLRATNRSTTVSDENADLDRAQRAQTEAGKINAQGYTAAEWSAMTTEQRRKIIAQGKGGAGAAPKASLEGTNAARDKIARAQGLVAKYRRPAKSKKTGETVTLTDSQIRARLQDEGIPKDFVNVAFDLIVHGYVSSANVKALHARGLSIADLGLRSQNQSRRVRKTQTQRSLDNVQGRIQQEVTAAK